MRCRVMREPRYPSPMSPDRLRKVIFLAPFPGLIPSPFRRSASSLLLRECGDGRVSYECARGFRCQVSLCVDHEISVQDSAVEGGRACARSVEADLPGKGMVDRRWVSDAM